MNKGTIFKALSGFYYVYFNGACIECRARGKFRRENINPLVGDEVIYEPTGDGKGVINEILPRRNSFWRPAVANIDKLVMIVSEALPVTDPFLIDRITAIAELKGCEPIICVNKCDIKSGDELYSIYSGSCFKTVKTSAVTGSGIAELSNLIAGCACVFTGNSGVGKSSLLNALEPELTIDTGEISRKLGRGKHTTRHVELFKLANDATVADTPGFSSFEAEETDLEMKIKLPYLFRDFIPYIGQCRYQDCAHIKESGCAIIDAVERGRIFPSRYHSYVRIYEQLKDLKEWKIKNNI